MLSDVLLGGQWQSILAVYDAAVVIKGFGRSQLALGLAARTAHLTHAKLPRGGFIHLKRHMVYISSKYERNIIYTPAYKNNIRRRVLLRFCYLFFRVTRTLKR